MCGVGCSETNLGRVIKYAPVKVKPKRFMIFMDAVRCLRSQTIWYLLCGVLRALCLSIVILFKTINVFEDI